MKEFSTPDVFADEFHRQEGRLSDLVEQTNSISAGTILIKGCTPLPNWFRFSCEDYAGWKKLFDANSYALEHLAIANGWHSFFFTPAVTREAFGLSRPAAMHKAVWKLMNAVSSSGYNSLEITEVSVRRLSILHWARVVADPRHLKPSPFLRDPNAFYYPHSIGDFEEIFWRAAQAQPETRGILDRQRWFRNLR